MRGARCVRREDANFEVVAPNETSGARNTMPHVVSGNKGDIWHIENVEYP